MSELVKFTDTKDPKQYEFVWRNNGLFDDGNTVSMTDALSHPDAPAFFPMTVENFVREAIEPYLTGTNLLQRINYKVGQVISLPSVGAMYAADIDEGAEYPERTLNFGAGVRISSIGKSGLAIKFTEEMKRYSQYDVVGLHLRAASKALARHKEQKIWTMLKAIGTITHDNVTPGASMFGNTSGRSIDGKKNGAITVDDIVKAYGQVMMNGYMPDVIIVHPMTFTMFMTDPVLRTFSVYNGGGQWFNGPAGFVNKEPWSQGAMAGMGPRGGRTPNHPQSAATTLAGQTSTINAYSNINDGGLRIPNYLGLGLTLMVSPFVPYNPVSKLASIFIADSSCLGAYIVDEEPVMDTVEDKLRDITKIKIRERYVIAPLEEGKGVAVLLNVKAVPSEIMAPTMSVAATLTATPATTAILVADGTLAAL